jgi:hypothetical protein
MTELLTRTSATTSYDDDGAWTARSTWLRGLLGAAWAVSVGVASLVVVVLVTWAADSRAASGAASAMRAALQVWLVGHHVPLHVTGAGTVALAPLLLTACLFALVARAAAAVARLDDVDDGYGVARVAFAVGLPYAALTTFVAAAATAAPVRPSPLAAVGCGLLLGLTAAAWGAARGAGLVGALWGALPDRVRVPAGAGLASIGVLLTGSTLLLAMSLAVHGASVGHAVGDLGGGAVAAAVLVVLDLALLPNAVACVLGYVAGPGFAVGAGSTVTMGGGHEGAVPALPLLAALPTGPASGPVVVLAVAMVVAAGALAAWRVARAGLSLVPSMVAAAGAGVAAGLVAAAVAAVAGGPAGPGRMATVGVSPWQAGLAVTVEVAVVAVGAVGLLTWRRGR